MGGAREIPDEVVEQAWHEVGALSEAQGRREIHRLFREQEALFAFVAEASAELSDEAQGLALYMAAVVYRAYEQAFPEGLASATPDQVMDAHEANETWLEEAAGAHERILDERLLPNLAIPQPAVLRYVGECLFEPDDEELDLHEDEQGQLFLTMKSVVDVLDECVAAGAQAPRPEKKRRRPHAPPVRPVPVYQLKVTLKEIRPPVWRRLQVRGDATLAELHRALQAAMGWTDAHLHVFRVGRKTYGVPDPEGPPSLDERKVRLQKVLPAEKARLTYEYDFGDGWVHDIRLEKILPSDPDADLPQCVAGRRACPPEDCGGPWGYADLLRILADPKDPEHRDKLRWLGGSWDPEEFDREMVNEVLRDS